MRNLDVQCCVYKIRNTVNDKLYIGFTSCLEVRWEQHKKEAKRGNTKKHIYRDMNLYGIDAFAIEIIEEGIPIFHAREREAYWMNKLLSYDPHGYKIKVKGSRLL